MARRSPMNNRYQKGSTPKGASRKSAASAKPKRAAGQSPKGKQKSPAKKKSSVLRPMPDTAEYKQYRKTWWYVLGAAIVLLLASFALGAEAFYTRIGLSVENASTLGLLLTWLAMLCVAFSWYLDFKKIRPLVRAFEASGGANSKDTKDTGNKDSSDDDSDSAEKEER